MSERGCSVLVVRGSRQRIPENLAEVSPGPELARTLAGIELPRLAPFDAVVVLQAQYRQANHERARVFAAMVEVGLCDIGPGDDLPRRAVPDEFAADEIRAGLVLTRRAADAVFWLAYDLLARLPQVHAAMDAGWLDEPRARVFSTWTAELSDEQARAVCDQLLPRAAELTTGQLVELIKKWAVAADPDWARRHYEQALADRKVIGYRNADGSANLAGYNLPLERVAAASGRIDGLAKAVKRAGDSRPIDWIRADLFLGMTDGTYAGLDDTTIIQLLLAEAAGTDGDDPGDDRIGPDDWPEDGPDDGPDSGLDGTGPADSGSGDDDDEPSADAPEDAEPRDVGSGRCSGGRLSPSRVGDGVELRVRLSTLLGYDCYPAELAGWGPLHAELARDLAATLGHAEWRYAIVDEWGQLSNCGITRARPTGTPRRAARARGLIELQVPEATVRALAEDPAQLGVWAPVVADLARRLEHSEDRDGGDPSVPRRDAAPVRADPGPFLHFHGLSGPGPYGGPGPHPRPHPRGPDCRDQPGQPLPTRPPTQGGRRLAPARRARLPDLGPGRRRLGTVADPGLSPPF